MYSFVFLLCVWCLYVHTSLNVCFAYTYVYIYIYVHTYNLEIQERAATNDEKHCVLIPMAGNVLAEQVS